MQCWEGTRVLVLEYCTRVLYISTCFVKVPGTRVPDLNRVLEYFNFVPILNINNT